MRPIRNLYLKPFGNKIDALEAIEEVDGPTRILISRLFLVENFKKYVRFENGKTRSIDWDKSEICSFYRLKLRADGI